MADVTGTLLKHRKRLNEIAGALARHGLAAWAARGGGIAGLAPSLRGWTLDSPGQFLRTPAACRLDTAVHRRSLRSG